MSEDLGVRLVVRKSDENPSIFLDCEDKDKEEIVKKPVYRENIIEQVIEHPVEVVIEHPFEKIIEKEVVRVTEHPIYTDNIIEQIVEVPVEIVKHVEVEHIVNKPVYRENDILYLTGTLPLENRYQKILMKWYA